MKIQSLRNESKVRVKMEDKEIEKIRKIMMEVMGVHEKKQ